MPFYAGIYSIYDTFINTCSTVSVQPLINALFTSMVPKKTHDILFADQLGSSIHLRNQMQAKEVNVSCCFENLMETDF